MGLTGKENENQCEGGRRRSKVMLRGDKLILYRTV